MDQVSRSKDTPVVKEQTAPPASDVKLGSIRVRLLVVLAYFAVCGALGGAGYLSTFHNPVTSPWSVLSMVLCCVAGFSLCALFSLRGHAARKKAEAALRQENETLRSQAERLEDEIWQLQDSEERLTRTLDNLGEIVFRRNPAGQVVFANHAFVSTFGEPLENVLGKPLKLALLAPDDLEGEADAANCSDDAQLMTVTGPRWFSRWDVAVEDATGGGRVMQTILRDVTDRHLSEEELQQARDRAENANSAKSRFLAMVSHEVRTPLNGILGMASLLGETRLSAEQKTYVDAVETSGAILLTMIEELLDIARIEAGRLDLEPQAAAVGILIEELSEVLAPKAQEKGLEIATYIGPGVPDSVVVDAKRLRQVIINFVGNGIKFTEEGGVCVSVTVEEAAGLPDSAMVRLRFSVTDTGIGFDKTEAARLFEEFEQIEHGPARKYGGSGLGLAISRHLVGLMGGNINVEAEPGKGARFWFDLDLEIEAGERKETTSCDLSGKTFYLYPDQRGLQADILVQSLCDRGARQVSRCQDSDLAILDCPVGGFADNVMPRFDESAGQAKGLVLVSPSDRHSLSVFKDNGFPHYLIKPIRAQTCDSLLNDLLIEGRSIAQPADTFAEDRSVLAGPPLIPQSERAPLHFLIVDDNEINRLLAEALLTKFGFTADVVGDGQCAIEAADQARRLENRSYDAIFMDLHMPGTDGLAAIRQIRTEEESGGHLRVPIYALTADIMPATRQLAEEAGADDFLTKPLEAEIVREKLSRLSQTSPQNQAKEASG